jgi:acyl-CoA thioester hydrolase
MTFPTLFTWPVRVYVEDTDFGGVVFYANYLKYFERARSELLRAMGIGQQFMVETHGVIFVVNHVSVDYRAPARMDDELFATARPKKIGRASIDFIQEIYRGDELLVSAEVGVACVGVASMRPQAMPEFMRAKLRTHLAA